MNGGLSSLFVPSPEGGEMAVKMCCNHLIIYWREAEAGEYAGKNPCLSGILRFSYLNVCICLRHKHTSAIISLWLIVLLIVAIYKSSNRLLIADCANIFYPTPVGSSSYA